MPNKKVSAIEFSDDKMFATFDSTNTIVSWDYNMGNERRFEITEDSFGKVTEDYFTHCIPTVKKYSIHRKGGGGVKGDKSGPSLQNLDKTC